METVKINLKDSVKSIKTLDINDISVYNDNLLLNVDNEIGDITKNQTVYYFRKIQNTDGVYETIVDKASVIEVINKHQIVIQQPCKKLYNIDLCVKNNGYFRLKFKEKINVFQQDIEESKNREIYLYDENKKLLGNYTFDIPMLFNDNIMTSGDCCIKSMVLEGCSNVCSGNKLFVFDYYFISTGVSRNDIIIKGINEEIINKTKFASFKFSSFIYETNSGLKLYSDIWAKELKENTDTCKTYNIVDDYSVHIGIDDSFYKLGVGLISDTDFINLGSEDNFNNSFAEELEESLIPDFIDMERIKYVPTSKIVKNKTNKKFLIWSTVRGENSCDDIKTIYTEYMPSEGNIENNFIWYTNEKGEFVRDNTDLSSTRLYQFGYEKGFMFDNGIMPTIYKIYDDRTMCKYYLTNNVYDEDDLSITGLTFYLHFLKRKEIGINERHLNTIYTSGNVYHDSWHIDPDNRETTWWNGFDYALPEFNNTAFTNFDGSSGKTSDLIGYLNFTDSDIFNQKKKVSQSFLRLSFYSSKDPIEQKLLYYSTIFLDSGELYGKYVKQLAYLHKEKIFERTMIDVNENAMVVLHYGDYVTKTEGKRVDTEIRVTNEYDRSKSSEGFNIYLFSEDKSFETENCEKTIYMKVEFNHAGNGKTIPLIMWPKVGNKYVPLTTENYIENLYIEVKISYVNGRYVYYIPRAEEDNYNLNLVLYEPKLDNI